MEGVGELRAQLPRAIVSIPEVLERALTPFVTAAHAGTLTASQAAQLVEGSSVAASRRELAELPLEAVRPLMRQTFSRRATWALFTVEWLDSLQRLLALLHVGDARVCEVCAGGGVLAQLMRARGVDWVASDANPPRGAQELVVRQGALEAVAAQASVGAVFWAWWSKPRDATKRKHTGADAPLRAAAGGGGDADSGSTASSIAPEDRRLVEACVARGIPVVFVSEPRGGITGSCELWDGPYEVSSAAELCAAASIAFEDVPQWPGFSDRTFVVLPPTHPRAAPTKLGP